MDFFSIDDIVVCKIKDGCIILRDESVFDEKISFKIIGTQRSEYSLDEYVIYVPDYILGKVKTGMRVTKHTSKTFIINPRFEGEYMAFIRSPNIVDIEWKADGAYCDGACGEFFKWAGPNQENGTFICGPCRQNPWR